MLYKEFLKACRQVADDIESVEENSIKFAAEIISEAVSKGRYFFVYDRGHLLSSELIARAGGAAFVRQIIYSVPSPFIGGMAGARQQNIEKIPSDKRQAENREYENAYIRHLLFTNGICEGDVLLINSVSGRGNTATAMARIAKEYGIKLIVLTSLQTCREVQPEEGNKRLTEYADVVIDNHAPLGDALFEVDGLDEKVLPISGVSAAFIGWSLIACTIELLLKRGIKPTVYKSVNINGGPEQNQEAIKRYDQYGY